MSFINAVSGSNSSPATNFSVTLPNVSGSRTIIVILQVSNSSIPSITDSIGTVYVNQAATSPFQTPDIKIYTGTTSASTASNVITANINAGPYIMLAAQYAGVISTGSAYSASTNIGFGTIVSISRIRSGSAIRSIAGFLSNDTNKVYSSGSGTVRGFTGSSGLSSIALVDRDFPPNDITPFTAIMNVSDTWDGLGVDLIVPLKTHTTDSLLHAPTNIKYFTNSTLSGSRTTTYTTNSFLIGKGKVIDTITQGVGNEAGLGLGTNPKIVFNGTNYFLIYSRASGSLNYASSSDGINWTTGSTFIHGKPYFYGPHHVALKGNTIAVVWGDGTAIASTLVFGTPVLSNALTYYYITGSIVGKTINWGIPINLYFPSLTSNSYFAREIATDFIVVNGQTRQYILVRGGDTISQQFPGRNTPQLWYSTNYFFTYTLDKYFAVDDLDTSSSAGLDLHSEPTSVNGMLAATFHMPNDSTAAPDKRSIYYTTLIPPTSASWIPFSPSGVTANTFINTTVVGSGYTWGGSDTNSYPYGNPAQHSSMVSVSSGQFFLLYDVNSGSSVSTGDKGAIHFAAFNLAPGPSVNPSFVEIVDNRTGDSFPTGSRHPVLIVDGGNQAAYAFYHNSGSGGKVQITAKRRDLAGSGWNTVYTNNYAIVASQQDTFLTSLKYINLTPNGNSAIPTVIPFAWIFGNTLFVDFINSISGLKTHGTDSLITIGPGVGPLLISGSTAVNLNFATVSKTRNPRIARLTVPGRFGDLIQLFGTKQYQINVTGLFSDPTSTGSRALLENWQRTNSVLTYVDEEFPFGKIVYIDEIGFEYIPGFELTNFLNYKLRLIEKT